MRGLVCVVCVVCVCGRGRALARIQKLPVQNDHFSQFSQSTSYLSHYKAKQFHQSWPTSAICQSSRLADGSLAKALGRGFDGGGGQVCVCGTRLEAGLECVCVWWGLKAGVT